MLSVQCPQCEFRGKVKPEYAGRSVLCPKCNRSFLAVVAKGAITAIRPELLDAPPAITEADRAAAIAQGFKPESLHYVRTQGGEWFIVGGMAAEPTPQPQPSRVQIRHSTFGTSIVDENGVGVSFAWKLFLAVIGTLVFFALIFGKH